MRAISRLLMMLVLMMTITLVRPPGGSAQVDPWSCDSAAPATPAASPTPVATPTAVQFPAGGGSLIVFAAASLTDAFTKIAADITAINPDVEITFNFAGSQALVSQIAEGGAEADVLALASPAQMKNAADSGIPVDGSVLFLTNKLVVVVPADNPAGIATPQDLAREGLRLVIANADVPAGNYARQSLCSVAAAAGMSDVGGFAANVVSEEDNVRSVLTKVELGEADAGIVYVTDAMASGDKVRSIDIPLEQNVIATYPIAPISDNPLAAAFVSYVLTAAGQATLESFGFGPVG
jgi:molybdate transport system substrate-binding protein